MQETSTAIASTHQVHSDKPTQGRLARDCRLERLKNEINSFGSDGTAKDRQRFHDALCCPIELMKSLSTKFGHNLLW